MRGQAFRSLPKDRINDELSDSAGRFYQKTSVLTAWTEIAGGYALLNLAESMRMAAYMKS